MVTAGFCTIMHAIQIAQSQEHRVHTWRILQEITAGSVDQHLYVPTDVMSRDVSANVQIVSVLNARLAHSPLGL